MADDYEAWTAVPNAIIEPGTTSELSIELRRRREAIGQTLTEVEKQPGVYLSRLQKPLEDV